MKKRVTALILTLALISSLLTMPAGAVTQTEKAQIESAVAEVINDYAQKLYRANADDDAFSDFFKHGFFGNEKKMVLTENSPMVSALFNSCLYRDGLNSAVTNSIQLMQKLGINEMYLFSSTSWHDFYYDYYFYAYEGSERLGEHFIGEASTAKTRYNGSYYTGPKNDNDKVMELLAGEAYTPVIIRKTESKKDTVVYSLDITIHDRFDFQGSYTDVANKGYDTSKDDTLKDLGLLMTFIGLDEFDWSYHTVLSVEVPNCCDHQMGAYRWTYDSGVGAVNSDADGEYLANPTTKRLYEYTSSGQTIKRYYYETDETVCLYHDRPWVLEYDQNMRSIQIGGLPSASGKMPTLYNYAKNNVWFYYVEEVIDPDNPKPSNNIYTPHSIYVGVDIKDKFEHKSTCVYTYKLENVVHDDGSNMIYLSIYERDSDTLVFGPEPMDDYWRRPSYETERTLVSTSSDLLSGRDIMINNIGNRSAGISEPGALYELRIWENGKDSTVEDTFTETTKTPTCTAQGGTVLTCRDCGYSYMTDPVPALGHSFGEYVYDNNSSCTEDGTQTRKCTVCGEKETITAPDTARGHSYESIVTEPTYTEQGFTTYTCTVCGDSYKDNYVDVRKHSYVGVVTEPTCTEQGYTTYTCSECGDSYVDDYTDMIAHTPVIDPAVKPTCSEKGKTEGSHCGVCGYVIKKQALISTNDNHTMEESIVKMPTYDEPGQLAYICRDCGKTDYMEIPPLNKPIPDNPFTDVLESDWFYGPVLWAVGEGVTGGKTATTFAPNEGCTRAQVVTFLWAANGKPEPTSENPFTDVSNDAWYLKPVLWAVENGITTGVTATEFGPDQTCTRAQIATFLWAANGKPAVSGKSEFVDVGDTDWYSTPIIWAKENDITGGIGDGKFGPNDTCTRAQVVTFLKKVYD